MEADVHEKTVNRTYFGELSAAMMLYAGLLVAAIIFGRPMNEGIARVLVLASPMIGVLAVVWVLARHLGRVDEFIRLTTLENMAIAAAATAGISFTYGFLETAGFPKLSMFAVLPLMFAVWGVVTCVRGALNR
jgi:uncharacterized protein (DUF697 family)